jgi:major membrane immunogen (membrane-anchored lipoprotein)
VKRITFWLLSTLSVVVLLFGYDGSTSATTSASPPAAISSDNTSGGTSSSASSSASSSGSGSSGSGTSGSTGGTTTVTGSVANTQWGPVQVELTVTDGRITDVNVLQYPSGNPKDVEINDYALPILTQETTSSQSASIDMVSGATVTSTGYIESLQSAIDEADL